MPPSQQPHSLIHKPQYFVNKDKKMCVWIICTLCLDIAIIKSFLRQFFSKLVFSLKLI